MVTHLGAGLSQAFHRSCIRCPAPGHKEVGGGAGKQKTLLHLLWASGLRLLWCRTGKSGSTAGTSQAAVTKASLGGWGCVEPWAGWTPALSSSVLPDLWRLQPLPRYHILRFGDKSHSPAVPTCPFSKASRDFCRDEVLSLSFFPPVALLAANVS